MSRTREKSLQLSLLEKEALDLRKLRKAKSYLKGNDALDKWFNVQISKRESALGELRMSEVSKYIKESNGH